MRFLRDLPFREPAPEMNGCNASELNKFCGNNLLDRSSHDLLAYRLGLVCDKSTSSFINRKIWVLAAAGAMQILGVGSPCRTGACHFWIYRSAGSPQRRLLPLIDRAA